MTFRYDNFADAQQQLSHCTLMTEKGGVHLNYQNRWEYEVTYLATGDVQIEDIRKIGLTFKPMELGYVNHYDGLCYIARHPFRMWKQGVAYDNIKAVHGFIPDGLLTGEHFNDTLMNLYPTLAAAYKMAIEAGTHVAFHRDFALTFEGYPNMKLDYKGRTIGAVNEDKDFEINEKFHYVKELLEEVIHAEN